MSKKIAVFAGSFDPFTMGHYDIVMRSQALFDEVIIGIGHNAQKKRFFELETTLQGIKEAFAAIKSVRVEVYSGLTAEFARQQEARFLIRGLRNNTDFDYENPIAQANKHVWNDLETVFLITSPEYAYISSSIVRDLYRYGKDVSKFVPYPL